MSEAVERIKFTRQPFDMLRARLSRWGTTYAVVGGESHMRTSVARFLPGSLTPCGFLSECVVVVAAVSCHSAHVGLIFATVKRTDCGE